MIITVGGSIGSGKSTLAKRLAQKYRLKYYSVGSLMRDLAREKGMSLQEISKLAERDPSIDRRLDEKQKSLAGSDCVIDSRLGAYMLDADFRIWLDVSPEVQAQRISKRDGLTLEEARKSVSGREESEARRYRDYYGIDMKDRSRYDLLLDTTDLNKEEMLDRCLKAIGRPRR